jgi:N-acetylneuraminate epimerase
MKQFLVLTITKLMFLTAPVVAQKKTGISIKWEIATELPADSGQQQSLGFAGPVTGVHNEILFIAGGANFPTGMPWQGGKKKYYNNVFAYTRKQSKLVLLNKSFTLPSTIAYPASCSTPNGVLYAGGENEKGISNEVWLMQWDIKTRELLFKALTPLPIPVSNAAATLVGHTVYIAGGETVSGASSQFLSLDLDNTAIGWKQLAEIPQPVSHTVLMTSFEKGSNTIYLCGGRKKNSNGISDLYNNVFVYDVTTNTWQEKTPLPYVISAGTGILYDANNIILFGGDRGVVFHKTETLIAVINAEKDEVKKQELIREKNKLQSEHPGFSNEVLLYNIKTNIWKAIDTIPFATPVTTTALKWKSCFFIPSGEIKAGVRSPNILSVKILRKTK